MLMMEEDNYNYSSGFVPSGDPSDDYKFDEFDADGLSIDLDVFNRILEENHRPPQVVIFSRLIGVPFFRVWTMKIPDGILL